MQALLSPELSKALSGGVISATINPDTGSPVPSGAKSADPYDNKKSSAALLIVIIVITLIIFITIVSYYDMLREKLVYDRTVRIADIEVVAPTHEQRSKILIVAKESYMATVDFAIWVTLLAAVLLPVLFYIYYQL